MRLCNLKLISADLTSGLNASLRGLRYILALILFFKVTTLVSGDFETRLGDDDPSLSWCVRSGKFCDSFTYWSDALAPVLGIRSLAMLLSSIVTSGSSIVDGLTGW